ncbi:MAG: T9SS type A sorting domain-containing protein, partial [Fidelibacterota bacterium]
MGILFQFTGDGGGDDETVGFFYGAGDGLVDPWVFLKFYDVCGGTSGNGGWHIRHWIIRTELAVELTGDRGPSFEEIIELNTTISIEDRTVTAHILDDNPGGGDAGVASAQIYYQIDSLTAPVNTVEMTLISETVEDGIWEGDIPGQEPGTIVYWNLSANDVNGHTARTATQSYYIFRLTSNELIFFNRKYFSWGYVPALDRVYFYWNGNNFDIWPASYGPLTDELLEQYDVLIEITNGDGPLYNNDDEVKKWWGRDKTYIAAGDEWLGQRCYGWGNDCYGVPRDILGITYAYHDINWRSSGDWEGISRLTPDSAGVASVLYEFLSDSLFLNYDPDYETGNYNWIDGFEIVDGYTVDMTAYSGVLDSNGNVADNAEIYNVMVHGQAGNGGKSAFMSFDPIALNTTPSYYWIGASSVWNMSHPNCPPNASPLISVYELLKEIVESVEDEIESPTTFSLKGNYPNPFNPTTTIQYELLLQSDVQITIYDLLGREVKKLVSGELVSGYHKAI